MAQLLEVAQPEAVRSAATRGAWFGLGSGLGFRVRVRVRVGGRDRVRVRVRIGAIQEVAQREDVRLALTLTLALL